MHIAAVDLTKTYMAMQYKAALQVLQCAAEQMLKRRKRVEEWVQVEEAIGRVAAREIRSPETTPMFDTAAADGFALRSSATINASPSNPAYFRVHGTVVAGERPPIAPDRKGHDGIHQCVEVLAGARLPEAHAQDSSPMDACVWAGEVEEVSASQVHKADARIGDRLIKVTKPVPLKTNCRVAGADFKKGDRVINAGTRIRSRHTIPLAAIGVREIPAVPQVRVGVWSTGREIAGAVVDGIQGTVDGKSETRHTRDVNGPYLVAALKEAGAEAHFLGLLGDDDPASLEEALRDTTSKKKYDVLITTGAVTPGKSGHVRRAVEKADGMIHFHGVAIVPGHAVLFATLVSEYSSDDGLVSFFGLPGAPSAAAACFRFLVVPYLRFLKGQELDRPVLAKLEARCSTRQFAENGEARSPTGTSTGNNCGPLCLDCFHHAKMMITEDGKHRVVRPTKDQNPGKASSFVDANCWVHLPQGQEVVAGALVPCYSLSGACCELVASETEKSGRSVL